MARIRVTHDIDDLANDLAAIVRRAPRDMRAKVNEGARVGNSLAKEFASRQHSMNSRYDVHYPRSFTWESRGVVSFGGVNGYAAEYGPDASRPQGGMSFEFGSRNQPPHLDLARSADIIAPSFAQEVRELAGEWFW